MALSLKVTKSTVESEGDTWSRLRDFATVWLESYQTDSSLSETTITKYFPDITSEDTLEALDGGYCYTFNQFLLGQVVTLVTDPVLREFLIKYLPSPLVYRPLIEAGESLSPAEVAHFIERGGFQILDYRKSCTSDMFGDFASPSTETFRKMAGETFQQMLETLGQDVIPLIPIILESYCYEADQGVHMLCEKGLIQPSIQVLEVAYRLDLTKSISFLEATGLQPNERCIGFMVYNDHPDTEMIACLERHGIQVAVETVYRNLTGMDHSKLLCHLYQKTTPTLLDLERLAGVYRQTAAVDYLVQLGIHPTLKCLRASIRYGSGSPFQLLVRDAQVDTLTGNTEALYQILEDCAGSQDIDWFGKIDALVAGGMPLKVELANLMVKYANYYSNSREMVAACLKQVENNEVCGGFAEGEAVRVILQGISSSE